MNFRSIDIQATIFWGLLRFGARMILGSGPGLKSGEVRLHAEELRVHVFLVLIGSLPLHVKAFWELQACSQFPHLN